MTLKVGIVGVGHFGKHHVRCHQEGKFDLVGFFDINPETSRAVKEQFGERSFPSYDALLEKCDVVDVVVPTSDHFQVAEKAIRAGKHVFIEKPVTSTLREAAELKELAGEYGVKIQVGHIERFNPAFRAVKEFIREPKFIELHRLGPFHPRNKDVPVVMDLLIHDIDIVLNLVESKVDLIRSSGVPVISNSPDITNARVEFANKCVANMTSSRISLKKMRKLRLFQPDAYITIDFLNKKSDIVSIHEVKDMPTDPFALVMDLGNGKPKKQIKFEKPKVDDNNAMVEELNSFYDAIVSDAVPEVPIEDGYNALELAIKIMDNMNQ
jgi:predicted dehydrogenase